MLLFEDDFIRQEGGAPLLMQNHLYLHDPKNAEIAWKKVKIWSKLLLDQEPPSIAFDDEKRLPDLNNLNLNPSQCNNKSDDKKSENYGLKIMKKPDRIIRKDAERTFLTEPKRELLITILESLKTLFNDYQQTMSYVSGILLLFFPPKTVFEMMFMLGRSPTYNMSGYWRSEAVAQGIDAYVLFEMIKKINPKLYQHLTDMNVLPDTFIQKWFGGLAVQVMPVQHLLDFWTGFFSHGFRYLFKFAISLLQTLSPLLLATNVDYKLYEVLRVERKTKFWQCIGVYDNRSENEKVSLFFIKVLSDTNSIGDLHNIDDIDFQKEREYAFNQYLCKRFLNAAQMVTFKGYEIESDGNEEDDEFKDCEQCDDGFAEVFCQQCQVYLCDECHEHPTGDHSVTHAVQALDLSGDDTLNID